MKRNPDTKRSNDTMPHDPTMEAAVLGALLLERQYVADVRNILSASAFYNDDNAAIFDTICRLDDNGTTPDLVTVVREVKAAGISAAYVAGLTQTVGSGVEVLNHARQLADMELRRRLILFGAELEAKAQADADNAVEWAISQLDGITGDACRLDTARPVREVIDETLQELERRQQAHQSGLCVGIATGLPHLDRITGGWRGGQLIVLAGRPAMGKTAVSLTFARAAAAAGISVCYFSLEMPDTQLVGVCSSELRASIRRHFVRAT